MIPYSTSYLTPSDISAVNSVLESNWLTRGVMTKRAEEKLCEISGKKYAVAMSNGTLSLMGALQACDELDIYSTTLTFSAVVNAAYYHSRTTPQLFDIDVDSLCTDWSKYYGLDGAIVAMDYAGFPSLSSRPTHFRGTVILDSAHSMGGTLSTLESNATFADMVIYSGHPAKLATGGEIGGVATDSDKFYHRLLMFRNNGFEPNTHNQSDFGVNANPGEMPAALWLSQMERLKESINRRHEIAYYYNTHWTDDVRVILPVWTVGHAWHLYVLRLSEYVKADIPTIQKELLELGVTVQRHYLPLHKQSIYKSLDLHYPVAEHAYDRMMSIPMFFGLSDQDVQTVIGAVDQVMEKYS
jgi:perosamine synthetase